MGTLGDSLDGGGGVKLGLRAGWLWGEAGVAASWSPGAQVLLIFLL